MLKLPSDCLKYSETKPNLFIGNANQELKYCLNGGFMSKEYKLNALFYGISKLKFSFPRFVDINNKRIDLEQYKYIDIGKTIKINDNWFKITSIEMEITNDNEIKMVECSSLEVEFCGKQILDLGMFSVDDASTDVENMNLYCLYNLTDMEHSLMHIALEKFPAWSIGEIDDNISKSYHTFTVDQENVYTFLTDTVAKSFECVIMFDTQYRTVNAYKIDNPKITKLTNIYLSYHNLMKKLGFSFNLNTMKNVLNVYGGDDRGNGNLNIINVNPSGTSQIANYDFYFNEFSDSLKSALTNYKNACDAVSEQYTTALSELTSLYSQLNTLNNHTSTTEGNWSDYGLIQLQTAYDAAKVVVGSLASSGNSNTSQYSIAYAKMNAIESNISMRKSQIASKEAEISSKQQYINSLVVNMYKYFSDDNIKELSRYQQEDVFQDDTFVIYDNMTEDQRIEKQKELHKNANEELKRSSVPQYELEVDTINFTKIPEFKGFTDQLELGCMIHIDYDVDLSRHNYICGRLIEAELDFNNPKNIKMIFSNKNGLDKFALEEIQNQAQSSSNYISSNNTTIRNTTNQTNAVREFRTSALNTTANKIISSTDEEQITDGSGTIYRRKKPEGGYYDNQIWFNSNGLIMTNNGFATPSLAIGDIKMPDGTVRSGVNAEMLVSKLLLSENLWVQNDNNTFRMDKNGFLSTNGVNSVLINPNDSLSQLVQVMKGDKKTLYFGSDGEIYTEANITGGSLNINNRFIVNKNGDVTLPDNARIAWGQIDGANSNVTQITRDTVTTSYVNSLQVTAGNVACENLTGNTISGKKFLSQSNNYNMELDGGNIAFSNSTCELIENVNVIGWNYKDGTTSTIINPNKIFSPSINTMEINVSGSSNLNIYGNTVFHDQLHVGSSTVLTSSNYGSYINISSSTSNIYASLYDSGTYTGTKYLSFSNTYGDTNIPTIGWVKARSDSDYRLKEDFSELSLIDEYLKISPLSYKFKNGVYNEKTHFGFIAQDLIKTFNDSKFDIVEFDEEIINDGEKKYISDGVYRINYDNFHALHVMMIKYLYQKITDIEKLLTSV